MTTANCFNDKFEYDYAGLVEGLNRYLRLKATPIGLKRFKTVAEMEAVPKVRHPDPAEKIAMDQVVGQTRWIGYALGITMDNLMGARCGAVVGLHPRSEEWLAGERMNGVWYGTLKDSAAHQAAMTCASYGDYEALVTSPLTSGRIDNPDICLIYMTPGQMITFINGLQHVNYKKYEFSCVGESACADSWGKALATGEPSVSIPCYAERKFGGVLDEEMLVAIPPSYLPSVVKGLEELSKVGLRYPIPNHGVGKSPLDSISTSYG
jgi:uncharacterized protein (DUF169 family)